MIATSAAADTGTTTYFETPMYSAARLMPMNSVTMVKKLSKNRSPTENQPQPRPKRSLISRACPTPVTAPRRTTISWLTMSTGTSSSNTHSSE